jgi:hypothetical protein
MTTFDDRLRARLIALDAAIPPAAMPLLNARPMRARRLSVRRVAVLAAVLAILGGATTTLLAIYGSLGGDAYQYAWNHSTKLALRETDQGYAVTLEAAYADAAQLMLAISVVDTENRGWSGLEAGSAGARFADDPGPAYVMTGGGSTPVDRASANTVWLDAATPPAPGHHRLVVTVPAIRHRDPEPVGSGDPWHEVLGSWTYEFDLVVGGGRRVDVAADDTVNSVRASAVGLFATPTTVRIDVKWSDRGPSSTGWNSVGTAFHDGHKIAVSGTSTVFDVETLRLNAGVEDASGHWKVVIDETIGDDPQGGLSRLHGPWVLEFDVPRA